MPGHSKTPTLATPNPSKRDLAVLAFRFRTLLNYVSAWVQVLDCATPKPLRVPLSSICSHRRYSELRKPDADLADVQPRLAMAWSTELLMQVQVDQLGNSEPIRYANSWLPVQCYYAVYNGVAAFNHLTQPQTRDTHDWNLKQINEFLERSSWLPDVFRYASIGNPDKNRADYRCAESNLDRTGSALRLIGSHERAVALALKSLKTTRIEALDRKANDSRSKQPRDSRGRLMPGGRQKLGDALPATTLFDFLWRLRTRSNYTETESLIHGAWSTNDAHAFAVGWLELTNQLLAFMETLIAGRVRADVLSQHVNAFAERASASGQNRPALPVSRRWGM